MSNYSPSPRKSKPSYYELLKDARWQEKRLRIMDAAGFECQHCGAHKDNGGVTLNVHHSYYLKNKKPWEYPDESLYCLCEDCHKVIQIVQAEIKTLLGESGIDGILEVSGYINGMRLSDFPGKILNPKTSNPSFISGFAHYWRVQDEVIYELLRSGEKINSKKMDNLRRGGDLVHTS